MKIKKIIFGALIIVVLIFAIISLNNYLEVKKRYNVNFNDCLMDYSGDFCDSQNLHLNDIDLTSKNITFICIDPKTKVKTFFNFPEDILNKCYGVSKND